MFFVTHDAYLATIPPVSDPVLVEELAPWHHPKGNLVFMKDVLPIPLIGRVSQAHAYAG